MTSKRKLYWPAYPYRNSNYGERRERKRGIPEKRWTWIYPTQRLGVRVGRQGSVTRCLVCDRPVKHAFTTLYRHTCAPSSEKFWRKRHRNDNRKQRRRR